MNKYSAKLSGLNRVNWNNKTEKQKTASAKAAEAVDYDRKSVCSTFSCH